jgi:hypothetical protein
VPRIGAALPISGKSEIGVHSSGNAPRRRQRSTDISGQSPRQAAETNYDRMPVGLRPHQRKPPSNAQCKQGNNADTDHQHHKRYGIVIEPMPTEYTHDAALTLQTISSEPFFFRTVMAGDGFRLISRAGRELGSILACRGAPQSLRFFPRQQAAGRPRTVLIAHF